MTAPALTAEKFAQAAEVLSLSNDYRVLTRFVPDPAEYIGWTGEIPPGCTTGLFVDTETTGLDTRADKIISLALVPFVFDADGVIYDAGKGLSYLEDPGAPLAPEIVEITGLTNEQLAGQRIDDAAVEAMVADAAIVISHHAKFDRRMLERRSTCFRAKAWACSYNDVPWQQAFGTRAGRLEILLSDTLSQFHAAHRAVDDCHVGVHLLANAVRDGQTALSHLLASARRLTYRVWAIDSLFQKKDRLAAEGFRWSPKPPEGRGSWYKDVHSTEVDATVMFARDIGGARPEVQKVGAKDRYSVREEGGR